MSRLGIKYEDFFKVMNELFNEHINELKDDRLSDIDYFTMFKPHFDAIVDERSEKRKVKSVSINNNITRKMGEEISDTYKLSIHVKEYVLNKNDTKFKKILKESINFNSDERADEAFRKIEIGFLELNKLL